MFDLMGVDHEWMTKPPGEWEGHEAYIHMQGIRENSESRDTADRGIALLKTFAQHVKGQDQLQWLLQAVERHRRAVPRMTKAALATL